MARSSSCLFHPGLSESSRLAIVLFGFTDDERNLVVTAVHKVHDGVFSTHPFRARRIAEAYKVFEPGVFLLEHPARDLLSNFPVNSKQVTLVYYEDDLGISLQQARFIQADTPLDPQLSLEPRKIKLG